MGQAQAASIDPIIWVIVAIAGITFGMMLVLRAAARRQENDDPLTTLFERSNFDQRMTEAAGMAADMEAPAIRKAAVLSGRLDHLAEPDQMWGPDMREQAIEQIAQVMRAGVRKTDYFAATKGEGFTILAEGASEGEASEIAKRLSDMLAAMPVPGMGETTRLRARFGVAERIEGESDAALRERAEAALDYAGSAAPRGGKETDNRIIVASDFEEVLFLPAPEPTEAEKAKGNRDSASRAA